MVDLGNLSQYLVLQEIQRPNAQKKRPGRLAHTRRPHGRADHRTKIASLHQ